MEHSWKDKSAVIQSTIIPLKRKLPCLVEDGAGIRAEGVDEIHVPG